MGSSQIHGSGTMPNQLSGELRQGPEAAFANVYFQPVPKNDGDSSVSTPTSTGTRPKAKSALTESQMPTTNSRNSNVTEGSNFVRQGSLTRSLKRSSVKRKKRKMEEGATTHPGDKKVEISAEELEELHLKSVKYDKLKEEMKQNK